LGDFEPEHQQFAMDPGRALQPVFLAHPLDKITQAPIDLGTPYPISRFPPPDHFKTSAMPTQDGIWLNHLGRTKQARPEPGHPYQQRSVTAAKSKKRWRPPQSDIKLMTEKQILGFKPTSRLEQVGDEHSERVQDRKHRFQ
jgi:hypothetical protein